MTRWKAAAIHLLIGLVVLTGIIGFLFALWYPYALYRIAGLNQLLITMLSVDLVAGPLLTCVVYKAGDRRTKSDLTVIGVLQAAFLGYALHTAWITRPVFLVWSIDHFVLVFANEIDAAKLAKGATPDTRSLSWMGPQLYAIALPEDLSAREKIFISLVEEQNSIERLPSYFGRYEDARNRILRDAPTISEAAGPAVQRDPRLESAIAATGRQEADLRMVSIESSRDASSILIDAVTAAPLNVLPVGILDGNDQPRAQEEN